MGSEEYLTLAGAQRVVRDAYLDHDNGLFTLGAVPGAGKTATIADVAARDILRRYSDGDSTPERSITVLSFNSDSADELAPAIADRIKTLVAHDASPAARSIGTNDLAALTRRVSQSPTFGTVDSLLRRVFADIAAAVGFSTVPTVGADIPLEQVHATVYADLAADESMQNHLRTLVAAFPPDEYDDGPGDLLKRGLKVCRRQRLATDEFGDALRKTVERIFIGGPIENVGDLFSTAYRVMDAGAAQTLRRDLIDDDITPLVAADSKLYDTWHEAIDAYVALLADYRRRYRTAIRETGVVSHLDVAYTVAGFLDGSHPTAAKHSVKRDRVLERYARQLGSLLIDEAQDISTVQHDALAPIVGAKTRVLLAGDIRQSIYVWRDARPSLFASAIEDGTYFGRTWTPHFTETTRTTYRASPGVAAAIDAICGPAITDSDRGNLSAIDFDYPSLDAAREPIDGQSVHVAAHTASAPPGTPQFVAPDSGGGEADAVATYLAHGLEDGRFTSDDDDPSVLVLFRWRTRMPAYAEAFANHGIQVSNATTRLFATDAVRVTVDVLRWLADPTDRARLQTLIQDSSLDVPALAAAFASHDWSLRQLRRDTVDLDTADSALVHALATLQTRDIAGQPPETIIETIIDTLALRADPHNLTDTESHQRVADCDALSSVVRDQTAGADTLTLDDLATQLHTLCEQPYRGPTRPLVSAEKSDVVFATIHGAKGDEADMVVLADPGFPVRKHGPVAERLITAPGVHALAPPATSSGSVTNDKGKPIDLGPSNGLYTPDGGKGPTPYPLDGGLRWATEHWMSDRLAGHEPLRRAVASRRAEEWRLLYVALSRARDHIVVPLPFESYQPSDVRDRWLDTIIEGLSFDDVNGSGIYSIDTPNAPFEVAVNDVDIFSASPDRVTDRDPRVPFAATRTVDDEALPELVPRVVRPSTLKPLADDTENHLLAHLQNHPLHTETDTAAEDLPLDLDHVVTETVGKVVHGVVTRVIEDGLREADLREHSPRFNRLIVAELGRHGIDFDRANRAGLLTFIDEWIVPSLLDSKLWRDIQSAERVFTEVPLRGDRQVGNFKIEIDGQADIVLERTNKWQVIDLKVALSRDLEDTRDRYRLQTALYADLLTSINSIDGPVKPAVETVGAVAERDDNPWQDIDVNRTLDRLKESSADSYSERR